ncbi:hypothetical protein FF011L_27760 [Roseimaritima multifibrata]|uniref:Alpha glucuronidase N-terminal domain-containing protein n=2 Tax=Roseimaritima multifibrata TaxID=1930274 RepID=A0A517MGK0_9BACT|nr:hypothetical protein FF011L_27760 [Roseimaritima multifibrata]
MHIMTPSLVFSCLTLRLCGAWLLVAVPTVLTASNETVITRFPVEAENSYRLQFEAESNAEGAEWFLRTIDGDGRVPHAGCQDYPWQQITPGKNSYSHVFRAPPQAASVEFVVRWDTEQPKIGGCGLEPVQNASLLINGDFQEGEGNFSGWSEHNNVEFIEVDGKTALKVLHNGYALTDPIPVKGNARYRFVRGSTMPTSVLEYDADLHPLTPKSYGRKLELQTDSATRYFRFLYQTSFDHIPIYRTNTITSVGLVAVDETDADRSVNTSPFPGEIVLGSRCDPREEFAARELQYWIGEITGKRIPVLANPTSDDHLRIFLGEDWATDFEEDKAFLKGTDGYAVRRVGNNIFLFGVQPRGMLFGVYAFLERNSDIIWPRPLPEFAAIFSKNPELVFDNTNFRSRPAFKIRELRFSGSDPNPVWSQLWSGRNGSNSPMTLGKGFQYQQWRSGATIGMGGGYIWSFIGLEEEDETLYPLVNGNRLRNMWRQPCYTHPDVPRIMAKNASEMLESVPGMKLEFLICRVGDNWEVCTCDECIKPIPLDDGTQLAPTATNSIKDQLFFSTRNYIMLNRMAEILVKDYPNLELHTHAYIFASEPPKVKLHPAIVPHYAAYPTKDERYPILEQTSKGGSVWSRRMRQWSDEQDVKFGYFGYYYASGFNALADTAGPDYKALAQMGGIHAHNEGQASETGDLNSWDVDGIEKWIITKLQWDPTQNPTALRADYIRRVYGDAAPQMTQFYQLINDAWHSADNPTTVNCHTSSKILFQEFIVNAGVESQAKGLLEEAIETATDVKSKKMIERTLAKFKAFAAELNRLPVPYVPESTAQWSQYESPHWYKAHEVTDFERIPTSQPVTADLEAVHRTSIAMMRDDKNLYFKIDAFDEQQQPSEPPEQGKHFPKSDRVEIVLRSGSNAYYMAFGADGGVYLLKNWNTDRPWSNQTQVRFRTDKGRWSALVSVSLDDLEATDADVEMDAKFSRVVNPKTPQREESTYGGKSIFNDHPLLRSPMVLSR